MQISITNNIEKSIRQKVKKWDKQVKFAAAHALTQTAAKAKEKVQDTMRQVFSSPKKFTINSMWIKKATKKDLVAAVAFRDFAPKGTPASDYLKAQIHGGQRADKRFEKLLQRRGVLPSGMQAVPSVKLRRDKHGNIPRRYYNQILSGLGAQHDRHQQSKGRKAKQFFVAKISGVHGIYQTFEFGGRRVSLVMAFTRRTGYRKRLPFEKIVKHVVRLEFSKQFEKSYAYAKRTAFK